MSVLTSASASRSSSSSASCSSSASSASSASSLTSSSYDGVTPSASTTGAESNARGGVRAGDDPAPTPAAAADDGGVPAREPWSRRQSSMQRPLILGLTTTKTRASHMLMKGRGKSKFGAGGGGVGRGGAHSWKRRRGPVVRLVSRRKNANNASNLDLLAAAAGSSNATHLGGGVGGGRKNGSVSSASGGSHRSGISSSGGGANGGRCKLQEFSFWVACAPTGRVRHSGPLREILRDSFSVYGLRAARPPAVSQGMQT